MVAQSVEGGSGDQAVAEHAAPFDDRAPAGAQPGAALVAQPGRLEGQAGRVGLEGHAADLVDALELGLGEVGQLLFNATFGVRPLEVGYDTDG